MAPGAHERMFWSDLMLYQMNRSLRVAREKMKDAEEKLEEEKEKVSEGFEVEDVAPL